jgi:hypothetical protein
MLEYKHINYVSVNNWDKLVQTTYNKPYSFQQQNGCRDRGSFGLSIPVNPIYIEDDDMNDDIPEEINGEDMGVKFETWLKRDPNVQFKDGREDIDIWFERNFYPDFYTLANDLYERGLIESGEYLIDIDW